MTDDEPPRRHRRRVVRPAGTVGGDEANLRTSIPAPGPDEVTWGKPMSERPSDEAAAAGSRAVRRAPDDEDVGWGAPVSDSNDDRLDRDRPPHW